MNYFTFKKYLTETSIILLADDEELENLVLTVCYIWATQKHRESTDFIKQSIKESRSQAMEYILIWYKDASEEEQKLILFTIKNFHTQLVHG